MPKYRDFSKGLNNANPSDQIEDQELSRAENVEYNHSTYPERRPEIKISELNVVMEKLNISPNGKYLVWAPKVMPINSSGSFVYFIYDTSYVLHLVYKNTSGTWNNHNINIEGVTYNVDSVISFAKTPDRVVINDGVNKAHSFKIDEDGLFIEAILEYPAPKYVPKIDVMQVYNSEYFETNSEENYMGDCGLYLYCWCYADENDNLSNPSPVSDPVDRQFFSYDTDGDADKWVEFIRVGNMKLPALDEDTKKRMKYIYLFRKYFKHSEDLTNIDWDLYNVYEIKNLDDFNEYIDSSGTAEGQSLDYGNIAPVADQALAQGDSIFLAGCKTKTEFLWDFEWTFPILVDNKSNDKKVNRIYRIRISEAIVGRRNGVISNPFILAHFFSSDTATNERIRQLCFFAQDKTTPLKSMLIESGTSTQGFGYFDAFIQVPELNAGVNKIYFCFTPLYNIPDRVGIPVEFAESVDKFRYGRMFIPYDLGGTLVFDNWGAQVMFGHGLLENSRNIVCCPMFVESPEEDEIINRYDDEWNGVLTDCTIGNKEIANVPCLSNIVTGGTPIKTFNVKFDNINSKVIFGDNIDSNNEDDFLIKFRYKFNTQYLTLDIYNPYRPDLYAQYIYNTIIGNTNFVNNDKMEGWSFGIKKQNNGDGTYTSYFVLYVGMQEDDYKVYEYKWIYPLDTYYTGFRIWNLDIALSISINRKKAWLYVLDENNNLHIGGVINLGFEDYHIGDNMKLGFGLIDTDIVAYKSVEWGGNNYTVYLNQCAIPNSAITAISYVKKRTVESVAVAKNIANSMYYSDAVGIIGYDWGETHNLNINIQEGFPLIFKEKNSVMWSSLNSIRFKSSNQKEFREAHKIMLRAPYFLKTEYGHSVLEITRNTINRINLVGGPDDWSTDSNNFIEEYADRGAYSPKGWGIYSDRVFGHTEVGFIMWDKNDFRIISNKRVKSGDGFADRPRIIVPMKTTLISFPVPLRNQYIWHDNEDHLSYVYHLDQDAWTIFTGLDIVDAQVIDQGDNLENLLLMLTSDSVFNLYPDTLNYTDASFVVKTKSFPLDDYMIKKIIPHFEGESAGFILTTVNRDGSVTRTFQEVEDNKIQYVQNGAWGHKFDIKFTGSNEINKLYDIEIITQRRF